MSLESQESNKLREAKIATQRGDQVKSETCYFKTIPLKEMRKQSILDFLNNNHLVKSNFYLYMIPIDTASNLFHVKGQR